MMTSLAELSTGGASFFVIGLLSSVVTSVVAVRLWVLADADEHCRYEY